MKAEALVMELFWKAYDERYHNKPVCNYMGVRMMAKRLLVAGYSQDEIVDALLATKAYNVVAIQRAADEKRRQQAQHVGRAIPTSVVQAFIDAADWLEGKIPFSPGNKRACMEAVAMFTAWGYGTGEAMLRLAVALRDEPQMVSVETLRGRMEHARVDRFAGKLDDYPDAMERAYRNRYWKAA